MSACEAKWSRIYDSLNEAGIELPFPQRDIHLLIDETTLRGLRSENDLAAFAVIYCIEYVFFFEVMIERDFSSAHQLRG